ncbi:hypothetical protein GALMADRAFT_218670 [Galerina marginata CBS 339.88]|uniref:DUF4246 domain-containing protein n=1 Tax=Galerina marginata (strain CBS 339.88) TaxID=685588 RepID=A0A067TZY3_GALM3|nr:hypothetical protein GALMADRAFT_218670 [Galerina marginata CBS 339.88]
MSQFSAEIRRSPEWWKHRKEQDMQGRWIKSALERTWLVQTPSLPAEVNLSYRQVIYVLDELEGYAALRNEKAGCQVSCFERIWQSDTLLDATGTKNLAEAFAKLRLEVPMSDDGITAYLIDHMLYPLVYNKTLVSHPNGRVLLPVRPPPSTDIYTVSPHFALLPSDVSVSANGSSVKFLSYISNLHPSLHRTTYELLEILLAGFIPLFEHTLTDLHRNNPLMQRIPGRCRYTVWEEPEPPEHSDDEEGWVNYERDMRQWALNRPINLPDVPDSGYPGGLETRRHIVTLRDRTVQVIVSASEISLLPQGPAFPGSSWHVEGMRSERIVACGFHCLSADNITESSIEFRMAVTYPRGFSAGDTGATLRTWGIRDGDSCHQYVGGVPIRPGLSLVFPNIYQQRQTPFTLADSSRQGHLTGIWFYLIDPDVKPIVSTSVVGPQQKSWIHKALDDNLDTRFPNELIEKIMEHVDGLLTPEEAQIYRREMVEAGKQFTQANNSYHFCIPFDIWNGPEVTE